MVKTYYLIRVKNNDDFHTGDGYFEEDIFQAEKYETYRDAQGQLKTFDQPEDYEIVRISIKVQVEEVM